MKNSVTVFSIMMMLSSCTLHPRYHRPTGETPQAWRTDIEATSSIPCEWWKQFGDESLDALITHALKNNQDIKVAIARVDQFQAQLGIARSKFYPQIDVGAGGSRQKIATSITALPPGIQPIFNAFNTIFNASYLVDLWGEVRSAVESSYHEWISAIEARRVVVLGVVCSVASTYFRLNQFHAQLNISQLTLKDREESAHLAQVRFELGLTSLMEVEQAISEVESAQVEIEQLTIAIAESENMISLLIGEPSQSIMLAKTLDREMLPPKVPAALPSDLVNQRPDLRMAEQKLIAANARIGVAKAKFFPQLSLTGAYGAASVQLSSFLDPASRVWEYGASILQEIFTGGKLTNNLYLTQAVQREMLHQYLNGVLTAFQEVNDALVRHRVQLELVQTQRVRADALKKYLLLSKLRYDEGQTDYLTYLDAERHYFSAELDYEAAVGESFCSFVQIYQALGGGWVNAADNASRE